MSAAEKAKRKPYFQSVTVDVDIDTSVLEENGYHHEEDCPAASVKGDNAIEGLDDNRQRLSDWHDHSHGLTLWASCVYEPCNLLTDDFRSTP